MNALNMGIAGLGRGLMLSLPALRSHPLVRIAAAFDVRGKAVEQFAGEFAAKGYDSLDTLVADPELDAIYVATPHELHAEQTIKALQAGLHVLVEKPMATTVEECARMVHAAEEAGKVLVVGPSHGFDEPVRIAARLVQSGQYGGVRHVTSLNFTDFMYRPRRPEELDDSRGGGVVYSQAAHQIDVIRRIVGQPVSSVRGISANWDASRPSDGAYSALMTFDGGAAASLTYSGYAHYDSDELVGWVSELGQKKDPSRYGDARRALATLSGEDEAKAKLSRTYGGTKSEPATAAPHHEHFGFLLVSCEKADLKVLPIGIEVYADDKREFIEITPPKIPRAAVVEEFTAAIAGQRPATHDGRWGLETMACCNALIQSSRVGTDVEPQKIIHEQWEKLSR